MLIQAVLMIFLFLGIATLVVDLGMARLTQAQMQTGVDTAALEGLRARDAAGGDTGRRTAAQQFVRGTYEDPETDPALRRMVGAGPDLTLTDGITEANASQLMSLSATPVYRPELAANPENLTHGDMVSGTYLPGAPAAEDPLYARPDFAAVPKAESARGEAFLVRMRRTDRHNPLDQPDGSSVTKGPPIPLLFGLATAVQQAPGTDYNIRFDGITVRATAIADGRPARRVAAGLTAPFALLAAYWGTMPDRTAVAVESGSDGRLRAGGVEAGVFTAGPLTRIGQGVAAAGAQPVAERAYYVPLYRALGSGSQVVAFGYVTARTRGTGVELTRVRNRMASEGASAHLAEGFGGMANVAEILMANKATDGALLAPVLVR